MEIPKNTQKLINDFELELKLRNYAKNTIRVYLYFINEFTYFSLKAELAKEEKPRQFLSTIEGAVSRRQAYCAIRLFYDLVLGKTCPYVLLYVRKEKTAFLVLTQREIKTILSQISNTNHLCMVALLYGSGLRLSEVINIRVGNVDLTKNKLLITGAKGRKSRITILPGVVKPQLLQLSQG